MKNFRMDLSRIIKRRKAFEKYTVIKDKYTKIDDLTARLYITYGNDICNLAKDFMEIKDLGFYDYHKEIIMYFLSETIKKMAHIHKFDLKNEYPQIIKTNDITIKLHDSAIDFSNYMNKMERKKDESSAKIIEKILGDLGFIMINPKKPSGTYPSNEVLDA